MSLCERCRREIEPERACPDCGKPMRWAGSEYPVNGAAQLTFFCGHCWLTVLVRADGEEVQSSERESR